MLLLFRIKLPEVPLASDQQLSSVTTVTAGRHKLPSEDTVIMELVVQIIGNLECQHKQELQETATTSISICVYTLIS